MEVSTSQTTKSITTIKTSSLIPSREIHGTYCVVRNGKKNTWAKAGLLYVRWYFELCIDLPRGLKILKFLYV
jgi:hypothetical protein